MPKQEKSIVVEGLDEASILSVCYSSFVNLEWSILFAGDRSLIAITKPNWRSKSQRVIVTATNNSLLVESEMTGSEMVDLASKNKENIDAFIAAFEAAMNSIQPIEDENNKKAIIALQEDTVRIAGEQQAEQEEVAKALNLAGSNLYATYTIIALNIIVFVLMALDGAGIVNPNGLVHLKWGSNYGPLTLSGDWWRLITNMFIHFGIIHLCMNMYTFFMVGVYLEPLLGKIRFVTAYLCSGILASITSLWWHATPANSAGASGAIFGMYGLFLAFLIPKLIPDSVRKGLLPNIVIFIVYNLAYGMKGGIDNSAHVGGLVSGFIIGSLFVISIKKEREGFKINWPLAATIFLTVGIAAFYLGRHKSSLEDRKEVLAEIKESGYKDTKKFQIDYNFFIELQKEALVPMYDTTITDEERIKRLKQISIPKWEQASALAEKMETYEISSTMKANAILILKYIQLRQKEISVVNDIISRKTNADQLVQIRNEIGQVLEKLGAK